MASDTESSKSKSKSSKKVQVHSVMEKKQERAWLAVPRPWNPQSLQVLTSQASNRHADVTVLAGQNESETLRRWYTESSKDQAYNAVGFVRIYDQNQSING